MATDQSSTLTEAELLYNYLGKRITNGGRETPIAELLEEFAEYRSQLDELRASIREAIAKSDREGSRPLDLDDIIRRGNERLAAKGILE